MSLLLGRTLAWLVGLYQVSLGPLLGGGCRFAPSCSVYVREALSAHGILHGGRLALIRLARCHPWGGSGPDPVPR